MTTDILPIHLAHLRSSKLFLKRPTSRQSVNSHGKHLIAWEQSSKSPLLHYVGTLMRCCEAWKPIENCSDPIAFECVDFQRLSQIIVNLTRENLTEREAETSNLPWTQRERKTMHQPDAELVNVPGVKKNPCFVLVLSLMKTVIPWKTKMNQEEGFVSIGVPFSKPASRARGITSSKISCGTFKKLLTTSVGALIVPSLMNSFP